MSKLVTIFGGSGFAGRYITRRLAQQGWRIRVAVRRPNEAMFVKPYGDVGQVEPVLANIRDDDSVRAAIVSADVVINCVGTFDLTGRNNFEAVVHQGAERVARIAAEQGVGRLVHLSAIGADRDGDTVYARTKGLGEAAVLAQFPDAVILRPSVIFGPEDGFFNRFAGMTRFGPVLPVVGAETRFQPVYVDDVAQAAVLGATGAAAPGIYELGGPEIRSFRDLMDGMLAEIRRRRLVMNIPFGLARIMGWTMEMVQKLSLGLVPPMITRDQVALLRRDNVVADGARGFGALGIAPTATEAVLPGYLWRFRPAGQYEAIKECAARIQPR